MNSNQVNSFLCQLVDEMYKQIISNAVAIQEFDSDEQATIRRLSCDSYNIINVIDHIENVREKSNYCQQKLVLKSHSIGQWHWPFDLRDIFEEDLINVIKEMGVYQNMSVFFGKQSVYMGWSSLRIKDNIK